MNLVTFVLPEHYDPNDKTRYDRDAFSEHIRKLAEEEWHYRLARAFMDLPTLTGIDVTFSHEYDDQGGTYLSAWLDAQWSDKDEGGGWDANEELGSDVPRHLGAGELSYSRTCPEVAKWIRKLSKT